MDYHSARTMGHLRFGVISPLLSNDDQRPLSERVAEQARKVWTLPDGRMRQYAPATITDWYYDYRLRGFSALVNPERSDKGSHRVIGEDICTAIDVLLKEHPTVRSSTVLRVLDGQGLRPDGRPSDATVYRYLRKVRVQYTAKKAERRAFEAPYAANLYQTDIMYGPYLVKRQDNGRSRKAPTYLLAILDDHTRVVCHGEFFFSQDLMTYLTVLDKAIRKRGIPEKIYCDNGKVFLSPQIKRLGAELGCQIVHTKVRDAAAKGKIERFFKTVRSQFLEMAQIEGISRLADLNKRFFSWCEEYNNRRHSAIGCTPMHRWLNSAHPVRLLPDSPTVDDLFLLEVTRVVKKDGTFSLNGVRFETTSVYAGKSITVRYDSGDLSRAHVYFDDEYLGVALPLNAGGNNNLPRTAGE